MSKGELELAFETLMIQHGIFGYERNYVYGDGRKHWDIAFPSIKVAVELNEEVYHKQWAKQSQDAKKANWAVLNGWMLLHVTGLMLRENPSAVMELLRDAVGIATTRNRGL